METPFVAILNKQNVTDFLLQNQRTGGQNMYCLGVSTTGKEGRRVWEGEYSTNTVYTYM
jgi:hypothetical protein